MQDSIQLLQQYGDGDDGAGGDYGGDDDDDPDEVQLDGGVDGNDLPSPGSSSSPPSSPSAPSSPSPYCCNNWVESFIILRGNFLGVDYSL